MYVCMYFFDLSSRSLVGQKFPTRCPLCGIRQLVTIAMAIKGRKPANRADAGNASPAEPMPVLKVGYDGLADVAMGICGYEGCKKKSRKPNPMNQRRLPAPTTLMFAMARTSTCRSKSARTSSTAKWGSQTNSTRPLVW